MTRRRLWDIGSSVTFFVAFLAIQPRILFSELSSPRCPCASLNQLVPEPTNSTIPANYGINCFAHDKDSGVIQECVSADPPSWCAAQWCYVALGACDLGGTDTFSAIVPGRKVSYETCGYENAYKHLVIDRVWTQISVNVVTMSNTGGWKGSICTDAQHCTGAIYIFVKNILDKVNAGIFNVKIFNTTSPSLTGNEDVFSPQVMNQFKVSFPSSTSAFSACVVATGMGFIDICIGGFTLIPARRLLSPMILIHGEAVHLVVRKEVQDTNSWEEIFSFGKPLTGPSWAAICSTIFVLAMMMMWHGYNESFWKTDLKTKAFKLCDAALTGALSIFHGGSEFETKDKSSRVTALGFSFLILLISSSYTAQLAAYLLAGKTFNPTISNMRDAIGTQTKICAAGIPADTLLSLYPAFEKSDLLTVKSSRVAVRESLENSECGVAVLAEEDIDALHAEGRMCDFTIVGGGPLFHINTGIAVSRRLYKPMQYQVTKSLSNGEYAKVASSNRPKSMCKTEVVRMRKGLPYGHVLGPIAISLTIGLFGIMGRCCLAVEREIVREAKVLATKSAKSLHNIRHEASEKASKPDALDSEVDHVEVLTNAKPMLAQLIGKIDEIEANASPAQCPDPSKAEELERAPAPPQCSVPCSSSDLATESDPELCNI